MESSQRRRKFLFVCLSVMLIAALFVQGIPPQHAQANSNEIRVALFVDMGTGYRGTVPSVSLKGNSALQLQGEAGVFQNVNKDQTLRFSIDQYFLIIRETNSLAEARQVAQNLTSNNVHNTIVTVSKQNQTVYQVVAGSEASRAAITNVQADIRSKTQYDGSIAGSFRVQAGSFATTQEAQARVNEIQGKGYIAHITQVLRDNNTVSFEVWVGQEGSEEDRNRLQQSLVADFSGITFIPATANEYLIMQNSLDASSNQQTYLLSSPQRKLTVSPVGTGSLPLTTVEERSNRQYRGKMELSLYQNNFTVVNILPLDEYLYSVVGTEMATGWPMEALKTQAVMSRNFAFMSIPKNKYGIAHVSDTVFEQAYHGYGQEANDVRQAVDATKGELLTFKGQPFETFYYSNAGGQTAKGSEVWGNNLEHHSSVASKDNYPETVQVLWYRIEDQTGKIGYVSSEYLTKTGQKNTQGLETATVKTVSGGLNFRSGPSTAHEQIGTLSSGARVTIIEQVRQNNAYSWITGPYNGAELREWINGRNVQTNKITNNIQSLRVMRYGDSGRVLQMEANGTIIQTSSPDSHRSIFKDGTANLRSTKFEVESMGEYTILGANGNTVRSTQRTGQLYAIQGNQTTAQPVNGSNDQFAAINRSGEMSILSKEPRFRLHGNGYGHGLGASQWGIRAMALDGSNYQQILQHYFHKDARIEKKY
ncbi:SpoIID/LytB domain-containing protein [Bacillus horti]|uniref:Stage II sporulation protein D n=1 Tax=Caldalkalibacillus horti TaxID=77523 RepID=A0ABT9VTS2_9BACI|nr:SpoIID/LytB domain-containing protein [Bacillus horti]MDQ0164252.1 stage II sporulation protein D [Bacillus horti]